MWFSLSETDPYVNSLCEAPGHEPGVPQVDLIPGSTAKFYLWGRPQFDEAERQYLRLQNFSLNLDLPSSLVDVTRVEVYNPTGDGGDQDKRFAYVLDSTESVAVGETSYPNFSSPGVERFAGFTILPPTANTGIGPVCDVFDEKQACVVTDDGPAWRLAEFEVTAGTGLGSANAHLEIGSIGVNHTGETLPFTQLIFGDDSNGVVYDVADPVHRDPTQVPFLPADTQDVTFSIEPYYPGDVNGDGDVDLLDLDILGFNFGKPPPRTRQQGDLNGDGVVDLLDLDIMGRCFGATHGAASVPEPSLLGLAVLGSLVACCSAAPRRLRRPGLALTLVCLGVAPQASQAVQLNAEWLGVAGPNWDVPANWTTVDFPDNAADTYAVTIAGVAGPNPSLQTDVTIDALSITDPAAQLTVQNATLTVLSPIEISEGSVQLLDGVTLDANVNVSGASATLTVADDLTLTDNTINVSGANSSVALVGGLGNLTLELGADATAVLSGAGASIATLLNDNLLNRGTIRAETAGTRGLLANTLINEGLIHAAGGTLTVNSMGAFDNAGALRVDSGARIEVFPGVAYEHVGDAVLQGEGTIAVDSNLDGAIDLLDLAGDGFVNSAVVRPGNSPGIITVDGNYTQTSEGVLEIEINGLDEGTDHDQLVVTGSADLAGQLDLPLGYSPTAGDSIQYLTATGITGRFDRYRVTGLPETVALSLTYPADFAGAAGWVNFVSRTFRSLDPGAPSPASWSAAATWGGSLVDSTSVVTLSNASVGTTSVVEVTAPSAGGPINAAHEIDLGGGAGAVELSVGSTDLSVSRTTTVMSNGTLTLGAGSRLLSETITVEGGGLVTGEGDLVGDVRVGLTGSGGAVFAPDAASPSDAGRIAIEGDYEQETLGVYSVGVFGVSDGDHHDAITVTGDVDLGGTLRIDVSDLSTADIVFGATYEIITSEGAITDRFDDVEIIGRDDVYFQVEYNGVSAPSSSFALASSNQDTSIRLFGMGDGNGDRVIDADDATVFAQVLVDNTPRIIQYECGNATCQRFAIWKNVFDFTDTTPDDSRTVDFSDIQKFVELLSESRGISLASAYQIVDTAIAEARDQGVVPEPSAALLAAGALMSSAFPRRRR